MFKASNNDTKIVFTKYRRAFKNPINKLYGNFAKIIYSFSKFEDLLLH